MPVWARDVGLISNRCLPLPSASPERLAIIVLVQFSYTNIFPRVQIVGSNQKSLRRAAAQEGIKKAR